VDQRVTDRHARVDEHIRSSSAESRTLELPIQRADEATSQFVAYASPYLFWVTIVAIGGGFLMMQ
jgi:hypothetical protein